MLNQVELLGNLGSDPEKRFTQSGVSVCNMRVATNEKWTDKEGNKKESVERHRVVCWNKLADLCAEYLTKGRQIYVSGKLKTRSWVDNDSNKRFTTEIVANKVIFLGGGRETKQEENSSDEVADEVATDGQHLLESNVPF